jgi:hypothetical protein
VSEGRDCARSIALALTATVSLTMANALVCGCGPAPAGETDAGEECPLISQAPGDARALTCAAHPWSPPVCDPSVPQAPLPCVDLLDDLAPCEISLCTYASCADAMAERPCGAPRPPECADLTECLNS